jgi:hypothetical protein
VRVSLGRSEASLASWKGALLFVLSLASSFFVVVASSRTRSTLTTCYATTTSIPGSNSFVDRSRVDQHEPLGASDHGTRSGGHQRR